MKLLVLSLCALQCCMVQSRIQVLMDHAVADVNKDYFEMLEIVPIRSIERVLEFNLTGKSIKTIPGDTLMSLVLMRKRQGEYTSKMGLDFSGAMCNTTNDPYIFKNLFEASKVSIEDCNILPSDIHLTNYKPPMDAFPPIFTPVPNAAAYVYAPVMVTKKIERIYTLMMQMG